MLNFDEGPNPILAIRALVELGKHAEARLALLRLPKEDVKYVRNAIATLTGVVL